MGEKLENVYDSAIMQQSCSNKILLAFRKLQQLNAVIGFIAIYLMECSSSTMLKWPIAYSEMQ